MRLQFQRGAGSHVASRWTMTLGVLAPLLLLAMSSGAEGEVWRWFGKQPEVAHQAPCPPNMITLAKEVTRLEDNLRKNGSITIKQPDVWGDSNLMAFIQEYETQMKGSVDHFRETIQGYISRSDTAQAASSTSLSVGTGFSAEDLKATRTAADNAATTQPTATSPSPPAPLKAVYSVVKPTSVGGDGTVRETPFGLEPNELERQHSVYIQMNQSLRRTNMGDDNSRAAGNALYLFRFPVSVLPGRETYEGYSAVVTLRAHMVLGTNHLRYIFPKLAVSDAIDGVLPILKANWKKDAVLLSKTSPSASSSDKNSFNLLGPLSQGVNQILPPIVAGSNYQAIRQYGTTELTALLKFVKRQFSSDNPPKDEELKAFLFTQFVGLYEQLIENGLFSPSEQPGSILDILAFVGGDLRKGDCGNLDEKRLCWESLLKQQPINCGAEPSTFSWILGLHAAQLDLNIRRLIRARGEEEGQEVIVDESVDPMFHFYVVNGPARPN